MRPAKKTTTDRVDKSTKKNEQLAEALRQKLREIIDQPISFRSLLELEETARLGRELLIVGKDPEALRGKRLRSGNVSYVSSNSLAAVSMDGDDDGSLAYSSPAETFGATVIREIVGVASALMGSRNEPTPLEIVTAAALAQEKGMTELAQKLTAKLVGGQAVSALTVVPEKAPQDNPGAEAS